MGTSKKYWKGLDQLSENPEFIKKSNNEFAEPIPVEEFLGNEGLANSSTSRRDFLKYVGFSLTAATLAACEAPVIKTIPYVIKPEEVTPGIPDWYASTFFDGNDYCSVLVKTREGRPIKIEGNKMSSITKGGANARVQASVLSLYDTARITAPHKAKATTTWESADKEISSKLADIAAKGGNVRILSSTIISPSTKQVIADFIAKYPTAKHVMYDAVSYAGIIKANQNRFGKAIIPTYNFDKALTIVSIGADFLANWISPIEYATQYVKNRKVSKEKKSMSKHIQFETILSLTGANADRRVPIKMSEHGAVVVNLYNAIAKLAGMSTVSSSSLPCDDQINAAAKKLFDTAGQSLVVCGSNDTDVQFIVNGINAMLKSYGNTIEMTACNLRQGSDDDFLALVNDMKSGKVNALITYNTNPVYTAPASLGFADAYKKVDLKISMADRLDETAQLAEYVCPDNHYLESWNDACPREGVYSLAQPTIAPLFSKPRHEGTRCAQESLLMWAGITTDYHTYIQNYWEKNIFPTQKKYTDFELFWIPTLRDGVYDMTGGTEDSKNAMIGPELTLTNTKTGEVDKVYIDYSKSAQTVASAAKGGAFEAVLYETVAIGNGNQANNPWLQELPDPISKVTWDNYITMNPSDMKDAKYNLLEEDDRQGSVATVSANGITVELPVYPQPGQKKGTIGLALGYGRTNIGRVADGVGVNIYPFTQVINGTIQYAVSDVKITPVADKSHIFATTQTHNTLVGRPIVKETTLEDYIKDPASGNEVEKVYTMEGKKNPTEVNLWTNFESLDGLRWGLSIDLNSCIGCGACSISCTAENNVPVVGKDEVSRSREMQWIRIDRYYSSDMTETRAEKQDVGASNMVYDMEVPTTDNPEVVFQPMMCQHCNHAPCETVCPVMATNHSTEGLNQMIYNRCVGTRYCANNCPYKVRRFNWFNYSGNPKFKDVNPVQTDLGRMVINPVVVVRSRGVMEKCSMCIQRIQGGKLKAKIEKRPLKDGEIQTACAQSCPTNAIVFGNMNDDNSEVANLGKDERMYHVLEELGVLPSVFYLTKVRNSDTVKEGA